MKTTKAIRIVSKPRATPAERAFIVDSLVAYNRKATGYGPIRPVYLFAEDSNGNVVGGSLGFMWGRWLHVNILWVAERVRGQDVGGQLLALAEAKAQRAGCVGSSLDTYSFQARPFYEKLGYAVFGTLKGRPVGHEQHFLAKRFKLKRAGTPPRASRSRSLSARTAPGTSRSRD